MAIAESRPAAVASLLARSRTDASATSARLVVSVPPDAIFFGGGLPDPMKYPTDAMTRVLVELLASSDHEALGYIHGAGDGALREAIAHRFSAQERVDVAADRIVITNGSSGALSLLAIALIEPGDVVLCEELTYPGALATFRQMRARIVSVPVDGEGMCTGELASILTQLDRERARVKVLYTIATCQSPTGTVLSAARRRELVDLADRFDIIVVQDTTYADIRFADDFPPELIALAPQRTVHVASFSKTLAPGLRLGWAAGPPAIIDVLKEIRTDLGTSRLLQRMVAQLISNGDFDAHLREMNAHYRSKRDAVVDALTWSRPPASWNVPAGGFFVWLVLDRDDMPAVEAAAARRGVAFFAAPYFSAGGGPEVAGIRLAYGELDSPRLVEGIRLLSDALSEAT